MRNVLGSHVEVVVLFSARSSSLFIIEFQTVELELVSSSNTYYFFEFKLDLARVFHILAQVI